MAKLNSGTRIFGNVTVDTFANIAGAVNAGTVLSGGQISAAGNILTSGRISAVGSIIQSSPGAFQSWSTLAAQTAVGTVQANAYILNTTLTQFTTVASGANSAILPTSGATGQMMVIVNDSANTMNLYPPVSGQIDQATANTGITIPSLASWLGMATAANTWISIDEPILGTANQIAATYGNGNITLSLPSNVSVSGNITGSYILGNGSQLTGISTSASKIFNGTSEANIGTSGGNANITISGVSNVAVFTPTGLNITGTVSASGNTTGGNLLTGGLVSATSTITSAANITGGNLLTSGLISAASHIGSVVSVAANVTGGNVLTGGLISATSTITSAANVAGGNLTTGGQVSATANITGGNLLTGGLISATSTITSAANITGGNLLTSGLISAASHIGSVVSVSANVTGGNILTAGIVSATGNISGNYFIGNGSLLTGISAGGGSSNSISSGNSNVVISSANANIAMSVSTVSNVVVVTTTGVNITGAVSASGNTTGGNLLTAGLVSATGNLVGSNLVVGGGAGGNLTGANVISANTFTASANITANYFIGNFSGTVNSSQTANILAVGYLGVPQNSQSAAYGLVATDAGKHIFHPASDANSRTYTIPANSNVAYPIGTSIGFVNMSANAVTIAVTSDTMYLSGTGSTGSRTLAQYGVATVLKIDSTTWIASGTGIS